MLAFSPEQIAVLAQSPTPFYCYDLKLLQQTLDVVKSESDKHGFHVHYAMKANVEDGVLELIRAAGFGADCVSGGEVEKALQSGFSAHQVVFAGVGKSDAEIITALRNDIFCFNCESIPEIEIINEHALSMGKDAHIALRINPNVHANTHHYITTGLEENKFGIGVNELPAVLDVIDRCEAVSLIGLHFHIGSQITDLNVFKQLCVRVNEIQEWFVSRKINIQIINVGGGLGVNYYEPDTERIPDFAAYFNVFKRFLEIRNGQEVHFELGRAIVAQCGTLISRALFVKKGVQTQFAVLDAGMTELIRPALYQAYHKVENLTADPGAKMERYDVVGPVCESSDCFGKAMELHTIKRGDIVAIRTAGAYGSVMASNYNLRRLNPPVFLK